MRPLKYNYVIAIPKNLRPVQQIAIVTKTGKYLPMIFVFAVILWQCNRIVIITT
jgi:uncharacterized YccA/Bax inhibitor family protein